MKASSFFGALWHDIQIGVRILTPFEGAISVMPGGSIVVTVLNILTQLNKIIPDSTDATKASLAAALTLANHPTVDPAKLQDSILGLLVAVAPVGQAGLHAVALVEQVSSNTPGPAKKIASLTLMGEMTQVTVTPETPTDIDKIVAGLNRIEELTHPALAKQ